jgi:VIT1/CCC1 family predicted Fe2+/Mn2+ transporter
MLMQDVYSALLASVASTLIALAIFGAIKGHYTAMPRIGSAVRTVVIGGLAAAAAFGIARLVSGK